MSQLNPDQPVYNAKYFARKFKAIPEEMWLVADLGKPGGPRCALGHTMGSDDWAIRDETVAFTDLGNRAFPQVVPNHWGSIVVDINNGPSPMFPQPTPKLRIVAAMEKAKEMGF